MTNPTLNQRLVDNKTPETYEYLSAEDQHFPFVIGPESVAQLHGMTHREVFDAVGFGHDWLNGVVALDARFHLAILHQHPRLF